MTTEQTIMTILKDITGVDVSTTPDQNLFTDGLLDSMATVELVLELENQCHVSIPISEMKREEWDTPNKIVTKVAAMQ